MAHHAEKRALAGSPAHAGIDRRDWGRIGAGKGFPRTRGDRPCGTPTKWRATWVPPHTRG